MITFTSKPTHTWVYTACIVLTAVGLLCLPELAFAQTATSAPARAATESNRAGKGCQAGGRPVVDCLERTRCQPAGSDIDVGRSGAELHRLR